MRFTHRAKTDLDDIWDYADRTWSSRRAEAYPAGSRKALDLPADQPDLAPVRRDIAPGLQVFPDRARVILFRMNDEAPTVSRIVPSRTNWSVAIRGWGRRGEVP
mgnify:FL=1